MLRILLTLISLFALSFQNIEASEQMSVFVSILPQKYFLEKIGGDLLKVSVMVQPGMSPETFEPKPQQMVELSKASIYFAIGAPFEKVWLDKILGVNPNIEIVHTDEGINKINMESHHTHGEVSGSSEGLKDAKDPHIWLSPPLVMIQAANIRNALVKIDEKNHATYDGNYLKFTAKLVKLDWQIRKIFSTKGKQIKFMVFHPAWGYFAQAYRLQQIPVEVEGKDPKMAQIEDLINHAKEKGIKSIFIQPQFSKKSADIIADAIGGNVILADPLAYDWENNLIEAAKNFKSALR